MEFPLTEPCPQCGAEMEPRGPARRGWVMYVCPECGHKMEVPDRHGEPPDEDPDVT